MDKEIPAPGLGRCEQVYYRKRYLATPCERHGSYQVEAYGSSHRYCRQHAQQAALNAADAGSTATVRRV